jgi:hypothetical protein
MDVGGCGLNSIQIQALVRDMDYSMRRHKGLKNTNPPEFRKKVSDENQLLYNQFPSIFEMHYEGRLDSTFFEMLKLRRKVELGECTEDQASRLIGQQLFDKYVAPVVGPDTPGSIPVPPLPVPTSYAEYYKEHGSGVSGPSSN